MEVLAPVTGHGVSVLETQGDGGTGPSDWSWGQCFRDTRYKSAVLSFVAVIVQELCESRGGRPGLSVLMSLLVSMDVKNY